MKRKLILLYSGSRHSCAFAQEGGNRLLSKRWPGDSVTWGIRKGARRSSSGRALFRHHHQRIDPDPRRTEIASFRPAAEPPRAIRRVARARSRLAGYRQPIRRQRAAPRLHPRSRGADVLHLELDGQDRPEDADVLRQALPLRRMALAQRTAAGHNSSYKRGAPCRTAGPCHRQHRACRKVLSASDQAQVSTEDLGSQTMEGILVNGVRTTHTIPAGQIGNEKPINIVTEVWTSPDLKTIVYSKRSDPRMGEQTFQLTNIVRSGTRCFAVHGPAGLQNHGRPPKRSSIAQTNRSAGANLRRRATEEGGNKSVTPSSGPPLEFLTFFRRQSVGKFSPPDGPRLVEETVSGQQFALRGQGALRSGRCHCAFVG